MAKKICLWSSPRNVSTALMYSFAQRTDTQVFDEPLYAYYLKNSNSIHPGRKEILKEQDTNGDTVVKEIILKEHAPVNFHKLMTHFLLDIKRDFLSCVTNILLIRDPFEIISSYSKVIPNPKMEDIGVKMQYELFLELKELGSFPIVLDSKELLKSPVSVLKQLCLKLDIEFDSKMLKWKKGGIKEDGSWSKYWYSSVHNSTQFKRYQKKEVILTEREYILAEECKRYYEYLYRKSIKV